MTIAEQLGRFAARASYDDLSDAAREQLKIRGAARIRRDDVQGRLRRVVVRPDDAFSRRFPAEMPCRVRVTLHDGRVSTVVLADYPGFLTRGRTWEAAREKLDRLGALCTTLSLRDRLAATVAELEQFRVTALTSLLSAIPLPGSTAAVKEKTR